MTSLSNYVLSVLPKLGITQPQITKHTTDDDSGLAKMVEVLDSNLDPRRLAAKMALVDDPKRVLTETGGFIREASPVFSGILNADSSLAIIIPVAEQKVGLLKPNPDLRKPVSLRFFNEGLETVFNPDADPELSLQNFKTSHFEEISVNTKALKELIIKYDIQTSAEARNDIFKQISKILEPLAEQSKHDRKANNFNSLIMAHPLNSNFDLLFKINNQGKLTDIAIYEPLATKAELEKPNFFLIAESRPNNR